MSLLTRKQSQDPTEEFENGQHQNGQHQNGQSQKDADNNGHRTPQNWHAPHDGKAVSEDEYWERYYEKGHVEGDASYEWNNGILEAKPMASRRQAQLYNWFFELLCHFLQENPVALLMNLEIGFRIEVDDPKRPGEKKTTNRKPDIGVILNDNEIPWLDEERSYRGICNMIVESLSDSDQDEIKRDTVTKKAEYEAAGIREYFILDPSKEHEHFYRLSHEGKYVEITPEDGIIRSEVLPGFQFRLSDFASQPILEEMAMDEIYQGFVLPAYQAALQQLDEERVRAEKADTRAKEADAKAQEERTRADRANERAERLAAKMRELGIDEADIE